MHIIEPQECVQWQIRSRHTSNSSSSRVGNNYTKLYLRLWVNGICATVPDASSSESAYSVTSEVVTGVEETTTTTIDASSDDGNRGGKVCPML